MKEKSGRIGRNDKRTGLNVLDTLTKNNNNKNLVARTDPAHITGQKLRSRYYTFVRVHIYIIRIIYYIGLHAVIIGS